MKEVVTEYEVINVFSPISDEERKAKINAVVRTLCVLDIEKAEEKDYNISVAFHGSVSDLNQEGEL